MQFFVPSGEGRNLREMNTLSLSTILQTLMMEFFCSIAFHIPKVGQTGEKLFVDRGRNFILSVVKRL